MANNKFLPKVVNSNKLGYYPVVNHQEWEELPAVYKAMDWFPVETMRTDFLGRTIKEKSFVKHVVFNATYIEPYGISGKVSIHRESVQKVLFCYFGQTQCNLYDICEVEFENGVRRAAKWVYDSQTHAFAVMCGNNCVGKQGGFMGYVPDRITETENGFEYKQGYQYGTNISHFELLNPFRK